MAIAFKDSNLNMYSFEVPKEEHMTVCYQKKMRMVLQLISHQQHKEKKITDTKLWAKEILLFHKKVHQM